MNSFDEKSIVFDMGSRVEFCFLCGFTILGIFNCVEVNFASLFCLSLLSALFDSNFVS